MEKASGKYSKDIFKSCERTGNSLVADNILSFSLMFHIAERRLCFNIFGVIFNEFKHKFVLTVTSLVTFPFSV